MRCIIAASFGWGGYSCPPFISKLTSNLSPMPEQEQLLLQIYEKVIGLEKLVHSQLQNPVSSADPANTLNWTLSKTDLIELVYALHSSGAFNKGTASIADIARFFEQALHIQLGNTSMTFQEILRRKDSTAFLMRLKEKLEEHISNIDERRLP